MDSNSEWVDLPGPASWWPESDTKSHQDFAISDRKEGLKEAVEMLMGKDIPDDGSFERMYPSTSEFWLMDFQSAKDFGLFSRFANLERRF